MNHLKAKLFEVPTGRINQLDEAYAQEGFGWVVDFSPDNIVNTAFRKEELLDFALFNEGNVYNKLFHKVMYILFALFMSISETRPINACVSYTRPTVQLCQAPSSK